MRPPARRVSQSSCTRNGEPSPPSTSVRTSGVRVAHGRGSAKRRFAASRIAGAYDLASGVRMVGGGEPTSAHWGCQFFSIWS
jgi:hypothetical protein